MRAVIILSILLFSSVISGGIRLEEKMFLPWGTETNSIGLRHGPGGPFGPTFIFIDNEVIQIIDTQNKLFKSFHDNQIINSLPLPNSHIDKADYRGNGTLLLLSNNHTWRIGPGGNNFITSSESFPKRAADRTERIGKNQFRLVTAQGTAIYFNETNIATVKVLGQTPSGLRYILVEKIINQIPLEVHRQVLVIDNNGSELNRFDIPPISFTYISKEFHVDMNGALNMLHTRTNGVHILSWKYDETIETVSELPGVYYEALKFPVLEDPSIEIDRQRAMQDFPTVTPAEALAMADLYVQHQWTATAANITNGRITDPNGVEIETPEWVESGSNYHVPYQWGGFKTLEQVETGLLSGKYAGDKATDCTQNYCVSSHCVGVDCSGFVSRCWKLPTHYSTRMMDDSIAVAYQNWDELQPGDVIHKEGHVRMVILRNPDGSFLTVEAAGYDWKVSYRSYYISQLSSYTPRYYIGMEGVIGNIPKPELQALNVSDSLTITWLPVDTAEIAGYNILYQEGNSWVSALNGNIIAADKSAVVLSIAIGTPTYYKMQSVSSSDDSTMSFPSDTYGSYKAGTNETILIVDGFDRIDGSFPFPYHEFSKTMGNALEPWGYAFESADNDAVISGAVDLTNYDAVFWNLGDESTADETFNNVEQNFVKIYLQQGGNLFISGSEIAWDLDNLGSTTDRDFIRNYLKVSYDQDDAGSYEVHGQSNTVFENLVLNYDNGNYGVYEENYPDAFSTTGGGAVALRYENNLTAAVHFSGVAPGGSEPANVFMMGFPFETIYDDWQKISLAGMVLSNFGFNVQLTGQEPITPIQFSLLRNYPNPFNNSTTFQFTIPSSGNVKINVYNLLGQVVATPLNEIRGPGLNTTYFSGNSLASGMYIYAIKWEDRTAQSKFLLVK
jgi:hypothetical protein